MSYDPMMDADEYHRKRELLLSYGWQGVGNYWYSPETGKRCSLRSALVLVSLVATKRALVRLSDSLAALGQRVMRTAHRARREFAESYRRDMRLRLEASSHWRERMGWPRTPRATYKQISRYPMLEGVHCGEGEDGS